MIRKNEQGRAIEITMRIEADADAVWRAITEPEEIKRWFPLDARGDGVDGGTIEVTWGEDAWWGTTLTTPEPGRHARFVDESTVEHGGAVLYMDYHLETDGGATVVRFVHSGFGNEEQWDAYLDGLDAGWSYFFRNLQVYLEHHPGIARTMAWARPAVRGSRAVLWSAVAAAVGLDVESLVERTVGDECTVHVAGTPTRGVLEAMAPGRTLAFRLPDLGQSLLFLEIEGDGENGRVGVWTSMYDPDPATEATLRRGTDALEGVLAAEPPAEPAVPADSTGA